MARPQTTAEQRRIRQHTAVLLVATVDRRIVPAVRFVSRLPMTEVRALHVSVDREQTIQLAMDWMNLGLTWLPLHIHEDAAETLPESVRHAVEKEAAATGDLTVVVPQLDLGRWWQPLLHPHSAPRIARQLHGLQGVTTVIVPFCLPRHCRGKTASEHQGRGRLVGGSNRGVD